jgi:hypothetical protein
MNMSILERLIERYESDEHISIDDLIKDVTQNDREYRELSIEEIIETKRSFISYCNETENNIRKSNLYAKTNDFADYTEKNYLQKHNRRHKKLVEAFISNITVTDSLDELYEQYLNGNNVQLLIDDINKTGDTCWTSPRWAKRNDIVLFMHAKTAKAKLTKIRTELRNEYDPKSDKAKKIETAIQEQLEVYKKYGGKIFAIGQISGKPEVSDDKQDSYFQSRVFCDIDSLFLLDEPIDLSEFNDFIKISMQGSVTPVFGRSYEKLKEVITNKNSVPEYFLNCYSTPFPHNIVNLENWMQLGIEYRNAFTLEIQFRQCYVDYLLSSIGDQKKIYMECACYKSGSPVTYVDNVIRINKKLLPVEVKLNKELESDLAGQCKKYCMLNRLVLDKKSGREANLSDVVCDKIMIIDTYGVYFYDLHSDQIKSCYDLDDLHSIDDVEKLRELLISNIVN